MDGFDGQDGVVEDNRALNIAILVNRGPLNSLNLQAPSLKDIGIVPANKIASIGIGEQRGSGFNGGFSNHLHHNPRIVGCNIWLMGDSTGLYEDPFWLATFDFEEGKRGIAHDGTESSKVGFSREVFSNNTLNGGLSWAGVSYIKKLPNITYSLKNGYEYQTQTSIWYNTSAIVNRRLYAGNVSYFEKPHKLNTLG